MLDILCVKIYLSVMTKSVKWLLALTFVGVVASIFYFVGLDRLVEEGEERIDGARVTAILEIRPADVIRSCVEATYEYSADWDFAARMDEALYDISALSVVDEAIDKFLSRCSYEDLQTVFGTADCGRIKSDIKKRLDLHTDQVCIALEPRFDQCGLRHHIQRIDGTNRICVGILGVDDPERAKRLLCSDGNVEFWAVGSSYDAATVCAAIAEYHMFDGIEFEFVGQGYCVGVADKSDIETINDILKDPKNKALLPARTKLAWENKSVDGKTYGDYRLVVLSGSTPLMNGSGITDARAGADAYDQFTVSIKMDDTASYLWANITANNVGKQIAIVMDDVVYSAPVVNQRIEDGNSSISGDFTRQEAEDLAGVLWYGRLPVDPTIVTLEVSER